MVYLMTASLVAFTSKHVNQYAEKAELSHEVIVVLRAACVTGKAIVKGRIYVFVIELAH
jgi:hypothetical protein